MCYAERMKDTSCVQHFFFAFVYCKNVKIWYHTPKRRTLLDGGGSRR